MRRPAICILIALSLAVYTAPRCFTADVAASINRGKVEPKLGKVCFKTEVAKNETGDLQTELVEVLYAVALDSSLMSDGFVGFFDFQRPYPKLPFLSDVYSKFNFGAIGKFGLSPYSTERLAVNISQKNELKTPESGFFENFAIQSFNSDKFSFKFTNLQVYNREFSSPIFLSILGLGTILKAASLLLIIRRLYTSPEIYSDKTPFLVYTFLSYSDIYSAVLYLNSLYTPWPVLVCSLFFVTSCLSLAVVIYSYLMLEQPEQEQYDRYSFLRTAVTTAVILLVFLLPIILYNQIGNNYPTWSLLPLMALLIDNYVYALDSIGPILGLGVLATHVATSWIGWGFLCYLSGMWHFTVFKSWNILILVVLVGLFTIQTFVDPRFGIRGQVFDQNEYLYRARPMLLEDLIKSSDLTDQDVCGICLLHFNPVIAQKEIESCHDHTRNSNDVSDDSHIDTPGRKIPESLDKNFVHLFLKTKCGHIFHKYCLETWCESQKNCPICRASVS